MSEQTTTARKVPASFGDIDKLPRKIPVRFVKLAQATDIPGEQVCERIKCDPKATGEFQKRWTVNFITALDSFEIMYHPADQSQPVEVAMLHVTKTLQWWPL